MIQQLPNTSGDDMYIGGLHVMISCQHPLIVGEAIRDMKAGETIIIQLEGVSLEQCGKVLVTPPLDFIAIEGTTVTITP
jgi:hypothetical protein